MNQIKKTPIPRKKSNAVDDLLHRMASAVGVSKQEQDVEFTPMMSVPEGVEAPKVSFKQHCEICNSRGAILFRAQCGHNTWLCPDCYRHCKIAMKRCEACDAKITAKHLETIEMAGGGLSVEEALKRACGKSSER